MDFPELEERMAGKKKSTPPKKASSMHFPELPERMARSKSVVNEQ
jgi:hypothetical protein